jgi:hypothetical protein
MNLLIDENNTKQILQKQTTVLIVLSGCSLVLIMIVMVFVLIQPLFFIPTGTIIHTLFEILKICRRGV